MGFLQKLSKMLAGGPTGTDAYAMYYYVRCKRCGEVIRARVNLANDLSADYGEGDATTGYVFRKALVGDGKNRCFQQMEVEMRFDGQRRLASRETKGGEFVTEKEFEAQKPGA
jgi:hypothetical protein